jgi:hypothetical protein
MTTTQQPTLFAAKVIKQTSAYFQTKPLNIWAKKYTHPKFTGRLTRANAVSDACNITVQRANNLFRYCYPLEVFFIELELLMTEQGFLAKKRTTVRLNKKGQKRLRDLSNEELVMLASNYHNVKDLSERNDSLRKHLTKRGLLNEVRLTYPTYTTSQAYIGINNTLIVKSVYELIFANLLTYARIKFHYDVDSGIRKKTKNFTIDFEVFFGEHSVFVELAQNLYVDESCHSSRRNEYAKNLRIKRGEYLHKLTNKNVHFIDTDMPYHAFYENIVQWINNYAPQADIATFAIAMVKKNESLKHLLDESIESVAFRIIDEYQGLANFKNKHSSVHTYLKQRPEDECNEVMRLAKVMSEKLRMQKTHTTRYDWPKPNYFTFSQFCQELSDSGLFKLLENNEVANIQEAYQKWIFSYDLHRKLFQSYDIEPPSNQFCPTPQTFYEEFDNWASLLHKNKRHPR